MKFNVEYYLREIILSAFFYVSYDVGFKFMKNPDITASRCTGLLRKPYLNYSRSIMPSIRNTKLLL